jgi:hypothetical protein
MAAHYNFLTESIITDPERAIQNIIPPTSNVMTHYRVMKERLLSKHGPNSQKDAEETRKNSKGLMATTEDGTYSSQPTIPW